MQASKINNTTSVYNYNTFADNMRRSMLDSETNLFSWEKLGKNCSCLFRNVPVMSLLYGPIGKGYVAKEKTRKARADVSDEVVAKAEKVIQAQDVDEDGNKLVYQYTTKYSIFYSDFNIYSG